MKLNVVVVGMIALLAVLAGCTQAVQQDAAMIEKDEHMEGEWTPEEKAAMEKEEMEKKEAVMEGEWSKEEMEAMEKEHAETMAAAGFIDYNKELFEKAQSEGKLIVLAFHADWCPSCVAERAAIAQGIGKLPADKVVVFEIHYKDDKMTAEHEALIKQYQIPYQHTKVVLKDGRMVAKNPKAWATADDFVTEITKFL